MTLITGAIVAVFAAVFPDSTAVTRQYRHAGGLRNRCAPECRRWRIVNPAAPRPFRAPLNSLSIAGAGSCLYLVSGLQVATWWRYGIWFLVGLAVYALYGFWNSRLRIKLIEP